MRVALVQKPIIANPFQAPAPKNPDDPWVAPTEQEIANARAKAQGESQQMRQQEAEMAGREKAWEEQAYQDALQQQPQMMPPNRRRANGGPVNEGEPYLVGENGPEIVMPWEDGMVVPNQQSDAMLDGLMRMLKQRYGV